MKRKTFDPAYKWQLIGHLDCTARDWVDFVSYCTDFTEDKQLIIYRLARKDCQDEIDKLRVRRKDFLNLIEDTIDVIIQ
ncbi:hypothetical protein [Arsenophonus endosymbiont of Aphis craccivora]|uniref:hypothetical protein n=1 Tax=Arsenophonus endosymbiont of Aphis craccivora TaxID=1231049 RepID=UPI0015DD5E2C|nr:hypothetical protein [Arsenophonus endosymbiont of Aphis craccivora]